MSKQPPPRATLKEEGRQNGERKDRSKLKGFRKSITLPSPTTIPYTILWAIQGKGRMYSLEVEQTTWKALSRQQYPAAQPPQVSPRQAHCPQRFKFTFLYKQTTVHQKTFEASLHHESRRPRTTGRYGSVMRSTYCTCRKPEFGSQHPHYVAHSQAGLLT